MCGIAGILHNGKIPNSSDIIQKVTNALSHRGPDSGGFYNDDCISLGHRRLSIIDLSAEANQPFHDYSGRYIIIFNGEMYNYQEVKDMLPDYPFRTSSDTEALLAAFSKWGPECINYFKGMYAFALWDKLEKALYVFRDRLGVKPLYYYYDGEVLCFASEVRALLECGFIKRKINKDALFDYFSYQSFDFPHSCIEGIAQLDAGSYMVVKNGKTRQETFWKPMATSLDFDFGNKEDVHKKIKNLLSTAVERRLVSDVPVGAFLSGGIDSSTVVGLMAEVSTERPNTFNISFSEKEYDEAGYAELIAKKFNTHHTTIRLRPEVMLDELQNALDSMDTPSGDGINTFVVSKAIKNAGITVALSGVGGDELFAGYPFFMKYFDIHQRKDLFKATKPIRRLVGAVVEKTTSGKYNRGAQILGSDSISIANLYPVFRQIHSPKTIHQLTNLTGKENTTLKSRLLQVEDYLDTLPLLSQVTVAEYYGYTQHTLLKDTDQMSMASALEVREPFFDHELIEFILSVPDSLKYPLYPKSLLIESIKPLLPDEIVHRPKQGFLFPWKLWMKNELRLFCEARINNISQRGFVKGSALKNYWNRFLNGDSSIRWAELWLFVVLEYWMEKNNVNN